MKLNVLRLFMLSRFLVFEWHWRFGDHWFKLFHDILLKRKLPEIALFHSPTKWKRKKCKLFAGISTLFRNNCFQPTNKNKTKNFLCYVTCFEHRTISQVSYALNNYKQLNLNTFKWQPYATCAHASVQIIKCTLRTKPIFIEPPMIEYSVWRRLCSAFLSYFHAS